MKLHPFTAPACRTLAAAILAILVCAAPSPGFAEIAHEEMTRFVQGYLNAAQQPTPEAEVAHYAKRVRYFDNGMVDQNFVAEDQRRYYQRWPERFFELLAGPVVTVHDAESATARFTIRYDVTGEGRRASGMTENTMRVQRFGDELRIVAMSERKVNARNLPPSPEMRRLEPSAELTKPSAPAPTSLPAPSNRQPSDFPPTETPAPKPQPPTKPALPQSPTRQPDAAKERPEFSRDDATAVPRANVDPVKATPVPGMPGFVYPPGTEHTPRNVIDVRGYTPGQKVKDPRTGQVFLVP